MNIEDDSSGQNPITEQGAGGAEMHAAPRSGSNSSRGGSRSKSASSNRSTAHSGRNASGAAVDKDAQRRGGQHSHGGR